MGTQNRSSAGVKAGATGVLCLITLAFLFQTLLENYIYSASYLDEAVSAFFLVFYAVSLLTSAQIRTGELAVSCLVVLTAAAGVYGNLRFGIQDASSAIVIDIISHFKFAAVFLGVSAFCRTFRVDYKSVIRLPVLIAKCYLAVLFVFGVANLFVNLGMYGAVLMIMMLLLLESALYPQKNNLLFLVIAEAVLVMVIKSRSLILATVFVILYVSLIIENKQSMRLRTAVIAVVAGIIGYPQYQKYFVNGVKANLGQAPRLLFLEGGIQLFKDHFPFGTGFGTFGSSTAASHYSSIYYTLGFDSVTGMSPEDPRFLNDTFWPMIFGQLGLAGTVPFVLLLFGVLSMIYAKARACGNRFVRLAAFWYAANVLISSIQSNYPGNNSMVMLTFMVTMMPFAVTAAGSTEADALPEEHNGH